MPHNCYSDWGRGLCASRYNACADKTSVPMLARYRREGNLGRRSGFKRVGRKNPHSPANVIILGCCNPIWQNLKLEDASKRPSDLLVSMWTYSLVILQKLVRSPKAIRSECRATDCRRGNRLEHDASFWMKTRFDRPGEIDMGLERVVCQAY